jgi:hypothetical protein
MGELRDAAHKEYEAKRKQWIADNYNPPPHLNDVLDFVDHGSFTSTYNCISYEYDEVEFV